MYKILILIISSILLLSCTEKKKSNNTGSIKVSSAMGSGDTTGFEKAIKQRKFIFPQDNGPHTTFRNEWWYFTGNVTSDDGRKFGYQFTLFRNAIAPEPQSSTSSWKSNQIFLGHLALTDINNNKFYFYERYSRDGNKLAGAEMNPFRIWIEDWEVAETGKGKYEFPEVRISASVDDISIELELSLSKPITMQGENGLSRKSIETGNSSYYYSATRINTNGKISLGGNSFKVTGYSWLDREWSTSALADYHQGWDWFSIQLDNNTEIMYYQLRKKDGSIDQISNGSLITSDGTKIYIGKDEITVKVTDEWKTEEGIIYPSGWDFKIPSHKTELKISPAIKNQELRLSVNYWEGSIEIEGIYEGKPVKGRGYAELTGYSD